MGHLWVAKEETLFLQIVSEQIIDQVSERRKHPAASLSNQGHEMDFDVILDGRRSEVCAAATTVKINPSYKGTKLSGQDAIPWRLWIMLQENIQTVITFNNNYMRILMFGKYSLLTVVSSSSRSLGADLISGSFTVSCCFSGH